MSFNDRQRSKPPKESKPNSKKPPKILSKDHFAVLSPSLPSGTSKHSSSDSQEDLEFFSPGLHDFYLNPSNFSNDMNSHIISENGNNVDNSSLPTITQSSIGNSSTKISSINGMSSKNDSKEKDSEDEDYSSSFSFERNSDEQKSTKSTNNTRTKQNSQHHSNKNQSRISDRNKPKKNRTSYIEDFESSSEEEIIDLFQKKKIEKLKKSSNNNNKHHTSLDTHNNSENQHYRKQKHCRFETGISPYSSDNDMDEEANSLQMDLFNPNNMTFRSIEDIKKLSTMSLPNLNYSTPIVTKEIREERRKKYSKKEIKHWSLQRKLNIDNGIIGEPHNDEDDVLVKHINILRKGNTGNIISLTTNRYGDVDFYTTIQEKYKNFRRASESNQNEVREQNKANEQNKDNEQNESNEQNNEGEKMQVR
ncbi:hypothetical protein TBLA_0G00260 [Henningerozyma blattae CBS 6284]|uniref:Uncharacterized protein n=1 Tax=Henningerozyma blattae (strain ATCC 34711 / CBS 6284 / DSM 70876 / NBRC 10599 / NRRL Y-10934 / UCD 77-7) TaxID=1071380 RepID=I2H6H3_HENB6|nr:hypothetical protein TBLA_0G00260 [Tetrapisispora blattae CBS 6284]CCH61975.1 hypothetical protein TBLA_0G00260 [Tetrapisispora blattae CBS 6284]